MGKRRARTGAGGAVVSSLSENSGRTLNRGNGNRNAHRSVSRAGRSEDAELHQLANPQGKGNRGGASSAGPSNSLSTDAGPSSLSIPSAAPKWLGKSPQQMLREWCTKNNRKRPYFSKMAGSQGLMRCTIPPGRKDGGKAKGSAYGIIIGVGDHPGDDFAALSVLHQVERGKPLERLLAPHLRDTWLDLDKRFEEMQRNQQTRAAAKEARKVASERRAKFEKSREAGTINISAASRQIIEDALVEQKTGQCSSGNLEYRSAAVDTGNITGRSSSELSVAVRKQLVDMGFSELDAIYSSRIFTNVTDAVDYLCLNLDESELPPSLAPIPDIEVVRFGADGEAHGRLALGWKDMLANLICLSRSAIEKVLRESHGGLNHATAQLYNILTYSILAKHMCLEPEDTKLCAQLRPSAMEERSVEGEALAAIYGQDATVGVGALSAFCDAWSAIVRIEDGVSGIGPNTMFSVAFVDADGLYPYTAPLVLVHSNFDDMQEKKHILSPPHRRLLMRAIAGEIAKLRHGSARERTPHEFMSVPIPVVHSVISFLSSATIDELLSSASFESTKAVDIAIKGVESPAATTRQAHSLVKGHTPSTMRFSTIQPVQPLKSSPALEAMQQRRRSLPAHKARAEIIKSIANNQVTVISGATGSGKTTQVPQFLLENASETRLPTFVICTQPRRIAAISVAERVASERCENVGGTVGYQVKLNSKISARTRLNFCTTGVLLRRLQSDPNLDLVTHVIVDEVHERSVETDFLLLLLRDILKNRPKLRVVLMSATLDAQKFADYFTSSLSGSNATVPIISIPGRTFPVEELYLSDAVQFAQYELRPGARYAKKVGKVVHHKKYGPEPTSDNFQHMQPISATEMASLEDAVQDYEIDDTVSEPPRHYAQASARKVSVDSETFSSDGNSRTVKDTVSLIDECLVNIDLLEMLVKQIDVEGRTRKESGAILIFLPGVAEISTVTQRLSSGGGASNLWPLPLHSLLSPQEQSKVFQRSPKGKRKVICATNIAETSITVEDVTVVIDTLRVKEMGYDALNGSSVLQECFISKAAAKQRAGRAGRVSKGTCYRLVRKHTFENRFAAQQKPEIKRVSLEHLVLNILSIIPEERCANDPHSFLASALDPPDPQAVTRAVTNLIDIGALEPSGNVEIPTIRKTANSVRLTALGKHLSGLPVDARIGKLLIYGSVFGCVDATLTIAATISERSPFFFPFDKREEAKAAREPFIWGKSDLLTFVKTFEAWREVRRNGKGHTDEQEFCSKHFLSRKTLQSISDSRNQLADSLADAGFGLLRSAGSRGWESDPEVNKFGKNMRVLRAVVCAALYPNIARIDLPDTVYREVAGGSIAKDFVPKELKIRAKTGERLFLHPESVNFHQGNYETRWLAYFSKVKTSKLFIRDTTMVSPYAILLFGGEIAINHRKGQLSVDKWVIFKAPARVAVLARELRRELDALLLKKFEDADMDLGNEGRSVIDVIIRLITTES